MAYIPNTEEDRSLMLQAIGVSSMEELFDQIPSELHFKGRLKIPNRLDQISLARRMVLLSKKNLSAEEYPSFLGAGVYDHYVPPTVGAILGRSEFYTSYTPYQPEMSQGMLQTIYEFQTLVAELTEMDVANASMYDGATALAEAALMAREITGRRTIAIVGTTSRHYIDVVQTYCDHVGVRVEIIETSDGVISPSTIRNRVTSEIAAVIVQQPNFYGNVEDINDIFEEVHRAGAISIASVDPIALSILTPPGKYGADIVVGEGQALGCPMGFGGPMLGFLACRSQFMRRLPGRIVGETKDADGKRAYVMTLRTREQDIRRERATSNICTNEALYALAATVYLATMGKRGLAEVGALCLHKAHYAAEMIAAIPGYSMMFPGVPYFKEFAIKTPLAADTINDFLLECGMIGGLPISGPDNSYGMLICVTEQRTRQEIDSLAECLRNFRRS